MAVERTSRDIRAYNIFKLVVTFILIVIIIILLLRARAGVAPVAQIVEPTVTMAAPVMFGPQLGADGTLTLSGTGTPGSIVTIWARDGELLGQTAVGADGTWSFVAAPLDPGNYNFSARAVDASGATTAASDPIAFAVPFARPVLISPQAGDKFTGNMLTLEGTGQPGAEIEILDNGAVVGKASVQAAGTWKFAGEFVAGMHALTVRNVGDVESGGDAVVIEMVAAVQPAPAAGMCGTENIPMGIDRGTTYIVARCEHMALIARRTGVTLADLIAVNPQVWNPNLIYPGQVLNLPPR